MAFDLVTVSLALVAFAWLMWVTVTLAFEERLRFDTLNNKVVPELFTFRFERQITPSDVKKVTDWLGEGGDSFMWAGAFFMLAGLAELASNPMNAWYDLFGSSPPPFPFEYLAYFIFIAALFFTSYGVYRTQQVVKFIAHPSQIDRIARFGAMFRVRLTRLANLSFITVNSVFEALFFVLLLPVWITPITLATVALRVLDVSLLLGGLALIPVVQRANSPTLSRRDIIGPVLVILPYAILGLILILSRFLS